MIETNMIMRETKRKGDVIVTSFYCKKTNLLLRRFYALQSRADYRWKTFQGKLKTMAEKHDLDCRLWESSYSGFATLKEFNNLTEFIDYVRDKFGAGKYSFVIKEEYIKVKTDKSMYVYKLKM